MHCERLTHAAWPSHCVTVRTSTLLSGTSTLNGSATAASLAFAALSASAEASASPSAGSTAWRSGSGRKGSRPMTNGVFFVRISSAKTATVESESESESESATAQCRACPCQGPDDTTGFVALSSRRRHGCLHCMLSVACCIACCLLRVVLRTHSSRCYRRCRHPTLSPFSSHRHRPLSRGRQSLSVRPSRPTRANTVTATRTDLAGRRRTLGALTEAEDGRGGVSSTHAIYECMQTVSSEQSEMGRKWDYFLRRRRMD